ncbi:MAG: hypothetical protein ACYC0V_02840 [Armatimonadota bacterium]
MIFLTKRHIIRVIFAYTCPNKFTERISIDKVMQYAGKNRTFRNAGVILMPHGRSFLRLPTIQPKNVSPSVGPYGRIMIALPSQKPGIKPKGFSIRK